MKTPVRLARLGRQGLSLDNLVWVALRLEEDAEDISKISGLAYLASLWIWSGEKNRQIVTHQNLYLVQLIEHPILWILNILFIYFLSIFRNKSFKLVSKYIQKCQYNL